MFSTENFLALTRCRDIVSKVPAAMKQATAEVPQALLSPMSPQPSKPTKAQKRPIAVAEAGPSRALQTSMAATPGATSSKGLPLAAPRTREQCHYVGKSIDRDEAAMREVIEFTDDDEEGGPIRIANQRHPAFTDKRVGVVAVGVRDVIDLSDNDDDGGSQRRPTFSIGRATADIEEIEMVDLTAED